MPKIYFQQKQQLLGGSALTTSSNTAVSNLNADTLDGNHASYFQQA